MQYGQDTGNPAATFHEVRVWKEHYEPEGKPLIPLRMVSPHAHANRTGCDALDALRVRALRVIPV